ncbi:MAG: hypothetical protein U1E83_06085 [Methylotetracoccus sp.]
MNAPNPRTSRNRWMLLLIASLSLIPFLLAWVYASHPELIGRRSNYGHLIDPALPIDYARLLGPPDGSGVQAEIKGRWVLLQVETNGDCGDACRQSLHATHQIRLMLNKDLPRVRRLVIIGNQGSGPVLGDRPDDPDLLRAQVDADRTRELTHVIGGDGSDGALILLDPFGNAMMWYPPGFDPYGVLKDLKHLLRTSQIG